MWYVEDVIILTYNLRFQDVDDDEEEDRNNKPTKRGNRGDTIAALKAKSYSMGVEVSSWCQYWSGGKEGGYLPW